MLLYIVRHGDPIYSPDSLTERGKLQAAALGKRLARYGVDRIYSSPLIRAQQTAEPTCILTGKTAQLLDWTSESVAWEYFTVSTGEKRRGWCFHTADGPEKLRSEEVEALGRQWYKASYFQDNHIRAEEGYNKIRTASDAFLAELGYVHEGSGYRVRAHSDERVAVFCHQGFGLSWLGVLLDIPLPVTWTSFDISHSDLTVIEFAGHTGDFCIPKMLTLSNDSHLYAEGLPTRYQNVLYF